MNSTQYGANLFQLTRLTAFNCFLVRESDGFTLVDTNLGGSAAGILAAAHKLGGEIRRITLTHAHIDHVGSLDGLHALLPNVEVSISRRDARFLHGDKSLDADEPQSKPRGGYPICTTVPTRLLVAGDKVGSLEVIAAPGHTPGHIVFLDSRDGTLIVGDAYSTKGRVTTAGTLSLAFPFPSFGTWHPPTALQTARNLAALKPSRLAVGHGAVIENPVAAMQGAIAEAARRIPEAVIARQA